MDTHPTKDNAIIKKGNFKYIDWSKAIIVSILLFLFGSVFFFMGHKYPQSSNYMDITLINSPIPTPSPLPSIDSELIFQNYPSNTAFSSHTTSITDSTGNLLSSFLTTNTDSTYDTSSTDFAGYISFSSGLLTSNELDTNNNVSVTKYSLYESNRKIADVSPNLTSFLNIYQYQHFIFDNIYLLGFNNSNNRDYEMTNLLTDKSKILFTISPIGSALTNNAMFIPQDISPYGDTISFIVDDETIGANAINTPSIIVYNMLKGTYTSHAFPALVTSNKLADLTLSSAFQASWDGNYLVYTTLSQTPNGTAGTLHLYSFIQNKDFTLPNQNTSSVDGGHTVYFSPDNKFVLADTGFEPWELYSTQTGEVIKNFNTFGSSHYNSIQPAGWINNTTLGFTLTTTTVADDFMNVPTASYSYNTVTDKIYKFPINLGVLSAVLMKSTSKDNLIIPTVTDTYTPTPTVNITPPEANIPTVDESNWKVYSSIVDNASFKYPPDWIHTTPIIQSPDPNNTDQMSIKSPDDVVQINWVTDLSGFGGTCDIQVSADQGGCPLVTIISKNSIPKASGLYLVTGISTHDGKNY